MSSYRPLAKYLDNSRDADIHLGFEEIERILGRSLPPSARRHPAWWSNTTSHSQASSWMEAGWKTRDVDVKKEDVHFVRNAKLPSGERTNPSAGPEHDDEIIIRVSQLSGGVIRLLEDYQEEKGGDLTEAVLEVLTAAALERRRRLMEWFRTNSAPVSDDSSALVREDRDTR